MTHPRPSDAAPGSGRPKDPAASAALKQAALRLVRERGYDVSITAIIKAAGVSRQTLYNRWNSKAELVLDAVFELAGLQVATPDLRSDAPRRELLAAYLRDVFGHLRADAELLRILVAQVQTDPGFRRNFFERFALPRAKIVTDLIEDAQRRGELSPERDPELLSAMIHGAFWYRLMIDRPLTDAMAGQIAAEIFRSAPVAGA